MFAGFHVLNLFFHESTGLRRRSLSLSFRLARLFESLFFGMLNLLGYGVAGVGS